MVRNIIILLFAMMTVCNTHSQVVMRYGPEIDKGWGDASAVVTPYVMFPSKFVSPYKDNSITKVRIGVCSEGTNAYLYIKNKPQESTYIYRQKLDNLQAGWNEITLDTPFAINGTDDIAIGYKASFAQSEGVGYSEEKNTDADIVYYNSKNKWTTTGGSVCIQAIVEGENMPQNEMLIGSMSNKTAAYDETSVTFQTTVRNVGANDIDSYTAICSYDGNEETITINKHLPTNASDTISFEVPSTTPGTYNVSISIDQVNGQPDSYPSNNTTTAELTVRDKAFMRRVVCEEYTGTWCGWCPRGIVGLEMMKEKYPDQFIAISIHGGDELEIDSTQEYSYKPFIDSCSGAPFCYVNRKNSGDPYYDIQNLFNMETATENHVAYNLTAEWNSDSTAINLCSVYYTDIDIESPKYNIAYTITEDSVTGYSQTNYYADGAKGEMNGWEEKPSTTDDVCFNDLARAIYSSYSGTPCPEDRIDAGKKYEVTGSIPVPPTVRNKRNLHVIGQIIDRNSGYIQNAMSVVPVAKGIIDVVSATDNEQCFGISRIGNVVDVIASNADRDMKVYVYDAAGICIDSKPIDNGLARIATSGKGLYIIKIYNGGKAVYTTKLIY